MSETTAVTAGDAAPPSEIAVGSRQLKLIFGCLMLGVLLSSLDQTIVTTALPTIVGDLGGLNHLSWVITAYLLAMTITTPLYGKLGDLYGRKLLFQIAVSIFIIGSLLCGIAQTMNELIGVRAVQGIGAGGLTVCAQAIIGDIIPPADRGRYSGLMASVFAVTSVIGPLVGGFFTDSLSWRWVFYINLPLGGVALVVMTVVLPAAQRRIEHRVDYLGMTVLSAATTCLILMLTWGGTEYGWGSPQILGLAVATVVTGTAFTRIEHRASEPVIPMHLLKNSVFAISAVAGALTAVLMIGATTFFPLFLQNVRLVSPTLSGVQTSPMVIFLLLSSVWTGRRVANRQKYRVYPIAGSILMVAGTLVTALAGTTLQSSYWQTALGMALLGTGFGLTSTVYVLTTQNSVAYRDMGAAIATASFVRAVGVSIGVSVFGAVFNNRLSAALRSSQTHLGRLRDNATHLTPAALRGLKSHSPTLYSQFIHAFNHALNAVFLSGIAFAALALVLAVVLKERPMRTVNRRDDSSAAPIAVQALEQAATVEPF